MILSEFSLFRATADVAMPIAEGWKVQLKKKYDRLGRDSKSQVVKTAWSVAEQATSSLSSERHAYIWIALNKEGKPCALLIGNDHKDGLIIRYLVANILDRDAKGSGTFLAQNMIHLAQRTRRVILTRPENSERYWQTKMNFQPSRSDPTVFVYTPSR